MIAGANGTVPPGVASHAHFKHGITSAPLSTFSLAQASDESELGYHLPAEQLPAEQLQGTLMPYACSIQTTRALQAAVRGVRPIAIWNAPAIVVCCLPLLLAPRNYHSLSLIYNACFPSPRSTLDKFPKRIIHLRCT
jgi:hypothetical protein